VPAKTIKGLVQGIIGGMCSMDKKISFTIGIAPVTKKK
jgi:hypothetical protein